jgi:hypothetical protein
MGQWLKTYRHWPRGNGSLVLLGMDNVCGFARIPEARHRFEFASRVPGGDRDAERAHAILEVGTI